MIVRGADNKTMILGGHGASSAKAFRETIGYTYCSLQLGDTPHGQRQTVTDRSAALLPALVLGISGLAALVRSGRSRPVSLLNRSQPTDSLINENFPAG